MKNKTKVIVGLYFILLCRKYAIAIECFRATSKTEYCEEKDYDKFQTPPNPPTDISIQLGNMEVSEVDDSALSISIRLAFYIYWNDSRIIRLKDGEQSIQLGSAAFEKYFLPDFYIYKLLDFKQMEFADPLKALLLTPAGKMWLYMEGIVTVGCIMDFSSYPYDSHRCQFLMGSTGFPDTLMTFEATYSYSDKGQRPLQYTVSMEDLPDIEKTTVYASGNYSVAGFWVKLERKISNHILQIIMPSGMFVFVSWISFLMPLGGGERAGLLVTLFLVLVSMFLQVVTTAPKASSLTAMETWVVACLVFVFLALIEYGIVLKLTSSKSDKDKTKIKIGQKTIMSATMAFGSSTSTNSNGNNSQENMKGKSTGVQSTNKVDKFAIVFLPIVFLLFNIVYWTSYTF